MIGKIWNKILDAYGYNQGTLFWYKDKREYHRIRILTLKQDLANAKSEATVYKFKVRLEDETRLYDIADHYIRTHSDEQTEPGWRGN